MKKKPEEMTEDECRRELESLFKADEIKVHFPTPEKLREAVESLRVTKTGLASDTLPWDSEDKYEPTDSEKKELTHVGGMRAEAKKRQDVLLAKKLKETGADSKGLTPDDLRKSREDLRKMLADLDDDEDED